MRSSEEARRALNECRCSNAHRARMPGCIYMVSKIAVGTLVCAPRGDGAIGTPTVWKLAKLLRLADYLTSTAEWKLTDLYLGVSQQAIEGTHTRSYASQMRLLASALQAAVGTLAQVRRGNSAVQTRSVRRTSIWRVRREARRSQRAAYRILTTRTGRKGTSCAGTAASSQAQTARADLCRVRRGRQCRAPELRNVGAREGGTPNSDNGHRPGGRAAARVRRPGFRIAGRSRLREWTRAQKELYGDSRASRIRPRARWRPCRVPRGRQCRALGFRNVGAREGTGQGEE
ncbi:uncharacterized protein TRAVEDRAFT_55947 [Trametes versicolor FP-101664 SS1]|uniref:uncharacterized protein n=1 Tax=Trametes versicolor (strain FP-101664) TaxID=717944 RepID=UPI0004622D13|nr:uncharacterized protein TRAVEDRAFT_55947 [Trametes versicolor FP-101664 SS1]EIW62487.1 hypothetical protein TRAVEDRAFT_55947 [Trametes versicolor FP-101664 SS1]